MKIIFAVQKNENWESTIDSRLGRAYGFLVYNQDSDEFTWLSNEINKNAGHGAGIQAGQTILETESNMLITGGDIGPKAMQVIEKSNMKIIMNAGEISVKEAYDKYVKK